MMRKFVYKGTHTKEISFPLGGIGTGCIGLAGNGRLIDWEIYNRPNKGSVNGLSHFAIKAESEGIVLDARVLNGDLQPPYTDKYGSGPSRTTMAGVPHFTEVEFQGEFPFAKLLFKEEQFPGLVEMTAFNPFIPLNDQDSSIPGAFFEISVENHTDKLISYTLCCSVNNPLPAGATLNIHQQEGGLQGIRMSSGYYKIDESDYGDLSIMTDGGLVSWQEYWYRGSWFDNLGIFWKEFTSHGKLKNRSYPAPSVDQKGKVQPGTDMCSLAVHLETAPGEKKSARFVLSWNFPNAYNYWNPEKCDCGTSYCTPQQPKTWKNYYASLFTDSTISGAYGLHNWNRLYEETLLFKDTLFASSLPSAALDAVSANISILKSPTCLRLEDGSFYGWEGCNCDAGCCEGSCTHVWNYAYALPFLFPKLERSMRDMDYRYNLREDGGMAFRLQLPIGREMSTFRPCADGQFGGVIKIYRDWKISGDTDWLKSNWEAVKKSIDFAWASTNEDQWDPDKEGVLKGRQHHTLDMELFGPNSWLTGFYLAALKAGAEMAEFLGENDTADTYLKLFTKGSAWVDTHLFNGRYYFQKIDLSDPSILDTYQKGKSLMGTSVREAYWNDEAGEIKYQIGEGCGVDQVVAQWHANLCGLGQIFHPGQTLMSLTSIYQYNFKKGMHNYFNPCRLYCLNDESGVVICDWPEGAYKPVVPVPYSEETMNGFEYQAAIHMIQEGLVDEGMEIVQAIRDRYDGERRNPWNEFECGSNYARSMASYALLLAFSGFMYDMTHHMIGFVPISCEGMEGEEAQYFWSLDTGWGLFTKSAEHITVKVLYGNLSIQMLRLPFIVDHEITSITVNEKEIYYVSDAGDITFENMLHLKKNEGILIKIK